MFDESFFDNMPFDIIGSILLGMIIMDFMWAYRLGIPQKMIRDFKRTFKQYDEYDE